MKTDIAKQSLAAACLTLTAIAVTAIWWGRVDSAAVCPTAEMLPGDWIAAFQSRYPGSARWIILFCVLFTGIYLGRFSNRYNLYAGRCYLTIPFFGMAACFAGLAAESLVQFVAALVLALAARNYCAAFRNGYGFNALFRASLYLGMLPLLGPAALPLWLLLPIAVFLFRRTVREAVVAFFGLGLPLFLFSYVRWGTGAEFGGPWAAVTGRCAAGLRWPEFALPDTLCGYVPLLLAGGYLLLSCGAVLLHLQIFYSQPRKVRAILVYFACCAVVSISTLFFSAAPSQAAALCAVPVSVLLPVLFVRSRHLLASVIYLLLLAGTFISVLLR